MQVHDVEPVLAMQSARNERHRGRDGNTGNDAVIGCSHRQVAVVAMLVRARDVVGNEVDRNDVLGQPAEQRAQVAFNATDVAVELAEVEDLHAGQAPSNEADAVT